MLALVIFPKQDPIHGQRYNEPACDPHLLASTFVMECGCTQLDRTILKSFTQP